MNKLLLHYLILLTVLCGCRNKGSLKHNDGLDTSSLAGLPAKTLSADNTSDLDSSMVALKTFHALSLEDAISQMWEFDDADKAHWNKIFCMSRRRICRLVDNVD